MEGLLLQHVLMATLSCNLSVASLSYCNFHNDSRFASGRAAGWSTIALDQMHHLRPFAAPCQKHKSVEISQNYIAIFKENSRYIGTWLQMPVISSKTYFDACFKAQMVTFYQTRHLRLFSERPVVFPMLFDLLMHRLECRQHSWQHSLKLYSLSFRKFS